MASPEILERLYDGVKDYFNTNYATHLAEIDKKLTTPMFELGYSPLFGRTHYPAGVIAQGVSGEEPIANKAADIGTELTCAIAIRESRPAKLQTNMLRYSDAMLDMVREDRTLGGICYEAVVNEVVPYQGDPQDKQIAVLVFTITINEEIEN